jgi:PAS domain S-box-containing protein
MDRVAILMVDDQPTNLVALQAILAGEDYELLSAVSGTSALEVALERDLALILLDVSMPDIDGFTVAAMLQSIRRTRQIPIVFLTAVATDVQHIFRAYDVGAVDYLIKPLEPVLVRKKVEVFARLARQRVQIAVQAAALREAQEREHARQMVEVRLASEERYRKLIEGIDHAIGWSADPALERLTFVSQQASALLGFSLEAMAAPGFLVGHLPPEDRSAFLETTARAVRTGRDQQCNHRMVDASGQVRWFHTGVSPEREADGRVPHVHGISVDISDVKAAEEAGRFLAEVSGMLSATPDFATGLKVLASLAVPRLAEGCIVHQLTGPRQLAPVAVVLHDPTLRSLPAECLGPPAQPLSGSAHAEVLRTGEVVHEEVDGDAWPALLGLDGADGRLRPGKASLLCLPLAARRGMLGVVTLIRWEPGRHVASKQHLAEEVCTRAGLVLENMALKEEAERAKGLRDQILAVVSHDLRNPLASIAAAAGVLRLRPGRELSAERVHRYGGLILQASRQMNRLIGDLLDIARIDAGHLSMHRRPEDAAELLRDIAAAYQDTAAERGIGLAVVTAEAVTVSCDRDRIQQALGNIISNALRFTPEGGRVELAARDEAERVVFSVADTGPGIPPEQAAHVFERYWRHQEAGPGVGIGLSIARDLVRAHGGTIWVAPPTGEGATVCFSLPVNAEEARSVDATDRAPATAVP